MQNNLRTIEKPIWFFALNISLNGYFEVLKTLILLIIRSDSSRCLSAFFLEV
jgi:hypothetical protein